MRLLYLSLLSFVLAASSALTLTRQSLVVIHQPEIAKLSTPTPVLGEKASFPILSAQAALAVDLNSGVPLYEKNPDAPMFPASTTKIITALVSLDYYPLDMVLTVGRIKVDGQKMGLVEGEKIKVEDLLYGLLVYSANDAAEVLAQNFPGGRDLFVAAMNLKAKQLHLEKTHFTNPTGLDEEGHVSTAKDLVRVSISAMKNPTFAKMVGTKQKEVTDISGKIKHKLTNINQLLGKVDGVLGVKTGWTENARENLVTYIEKDGKKVMIVLLGSQDRFGETQELIDWIFENYKWEEVWYP